MSGGGRERSKSGNERYIGFLSPPSPKRGAREPERERGVLHGGTGGGTDAGETGRAGAPGGRRCLGRTGAREAKRARRTARADRRRRTDGGRAPERPERGADGRRTPRSTGGGTRRTNGGANPPTADGESAATAAHPGEHRRAGAEPTADDGESTGGERRAGERAAQDAPGERRRPGPGSTEATAARPVLPSAQSLRRPFRRRSARAVQRAPVPVRALPASGRGGRNPMYRSLPVLEHGGGSTAPGRRTAGGRRESTVERARSAENRAGAPARCLGASRARSAAERRRACPVSAYGGSTAPRTAGDWGGSRRSARPVPPAPERAHGRRRAPGERRRRSAEPERRADDGERLPGRRETGRTGAPGGRRRSSSSAR